MIETLFSLTSFLSPLPPPPPPPTTPEQNTNSAFRGDTVTLTASRKELRARFDESRRSTSLGGGSEQQQQQQEQIDQALADAAEAADFLRTFVVQAKLNERGNYEMKLEPHHADAVAEEAAIRGSRKKE